MKAKEEFVKNPDAIQQEFDENKEHPQLTISTALRLKLSSMNEEFERLNKDLFSFNQEAETYQNAIKKQDTSFAAEISSHKDPTTDKSLYKNEFERNLAIEKLANANDLYQKNKQLFLGLNKSIDEKKAEIEIIKFKQRSHLMMAELEIARLGFLKVTS